MRIKYNLNSFQNHMIDKEVHQIEKFAYLPKRKWRAAPNAHLFDATLIGPFARHSGICGDLNHVIMRTSASFVYNLWCVCYVMYYIICVL